MDSMESEGVEISLSSNSNSKRLKSSIFLDGTGNPAAIDGTGRNVSKGYEQSLDGSGGLPSRSSMPLTKEEELEGGSARSSTEEDDNVAKQPRLSRSRLQKLIYLLICLIVVCAIAAAAIAASNGKKSGTSTIVSNAQAGDTQGLADQEAESVPAAAATEPPVPAPSSSAPTAATPMPTAMPTSMPVSNLQTVHSEYKFSESITILLAYGNDLEADSNDWIGIFPSHLVGNDTTDIVEEPMVFLFTCNETTPCDEAVSEGSVIFGGPTLAEEAQLQSWQWPLPPGHFKAVLLRGAQAPYQVLAQSKSFEIMPDDMIHRVIPALNAIDAEIRDIIAEDPKLGPKFVRLGFHDCAGGCNGCVDMTFEDNFGLEVPIQALRPIVERHENSQLEISRADIWALAAHIGADVAQERSQTKVDLRMEFIGRQNCEDIYDKCFNEHGQQQACEETRGPHVELPMADITTEDLFHFFSEEFGFNIKETVALMGAHTIGELSRENSGFHGPNGWVRDKHLLDNDYYHELVGGDDIDATMEELIEFAPPWLRFEIDNTDLEHIPDRAAWRAFPPALSGTGTVEILMLNADIAMVRNMSSANLLPNGRATCAFTWRLASASRSTRCPHAAQSLTFAAEYKFDNELWLNDFAEVYKKMLNHGYNYDPNRTCPGGMCRYNDDESRL